MVYTHVNWVTQWKSLFDRFPDTTFYKVNRDLRLKDNVNNFVAEWERHTEFVLC